MNLRMVSWVMTAAIVASVTLTTRAALADESVSEAVECGQPGPVSSSVHDYRQRDSTPQLKWSAGDIKKNHYDPIVKRMREGIYSEPVMADLDYLLRRWPNYYPGLQALIRYDLAGGKSYGFLPAKCYLLRAREFAPHDVNVALYLAYYYWKKGEMKQSKHAYDEALAIDPRSPDAHYDLGLLYLETGHPKKALEHAQIAYAAGYPLPGLREKLQRAGYWKKEASNKKEP